MGVFPLSLENYYVSETYGFLLENCLEYLPEYFDEWNNLAKAMPELVSNKELRNAVHKLEVLDHTRLSGHHEYRLAHLQLSIISAGYIWQEGDSGAATILPKCLSVPWCGVSSYLGIQPVISHPSLVLANWKLLEDQSTMKCLYKLPGEDEAEWFITVTAQVELAFASGLKNLMQMLYHAQCENLQELENCLIKTVETLERMKKAMSTMHERLSPETFYDCLRPFLTGWGGESSPLPDGIVYEGISDQPRKMTGGSAAQSSTVQCIDSVLGIKHEKDIREFLLNMRSYMPLPHRQFIETIEQHSQVKQVVESSSSTSLKSAYDECLKSVIDFRSYHIQIVSKYIILMANRDTRNKDYEALATKGTGGSSLLPFLKSLRTTTSACLSTNKSDNTTKESTS
ncbi:Indoleamine 2 [Mactra antiquata]